MEPRRLNAGIGLVIGAAALVLQFMLSVPATADSRGLPFALLSFFSFFTILSNLTLVLIYLSELTSHRWLEWFRHPVTRAMMVAVMGLVTIFYHLLLSGLWQPEGLYLIADRLLHYATTLIYWLWWWRFVPHGRVDWRDLPTMLLPTLVYFGYILLRGAFLNEYPYPILEVGRLGYATVLLNGLIVALGLAVLCAVTIAFDKLLARKPRTVS
ncbi:Pr6Pr family membrane protein [Devosia sp. RR2S18]|uniref:Pr6Pr family membrane protein n=1 Tax=Devosia rhizosphaerae TaxID=3049774 RepID=UPI00253FAE74|nr:Pr6Pr family membrane protein [Devosia sp. RR2S18]WIJ26704.1 Pr6Pr family membrane protein [Devosia sp. RR2S18]